MPLPLFIARRRRFAIPGFVPTPTDVFAGLPCTDLDVARYALNDFPVICEGSQYVAYGEDGAFAPSSFVLTSAFPFKRQGVQPGHVCVIKKHSSIPGGDLLAVASAENGACTLERIDYPGGLGAFPGKPGGSTGIIFFMPSLVGMIRNETREARREIGVITDAGLIESTDLKRLVALRVLRMMYYTAWKSAQPDLYNEKKNDLDKQILAHLMDLQIRYGSSPSPQSHRPEAGTAEDLPGWRVPGDYLGRYGIAIWTNRQGFN